MRTDLFKFSVSQAVPRNVWFPVVLLCAVVFPVPAAADCALSRQQLDTVRSGAISLHPVAEELVVADHHNARQVSVDQAVAHMQYQQCRSLAKATPASAPSAPGSANSFRFNMTQNGKRMTADEFDAWMKSQGVRVVKGPAAAPTEQTPPLPPKPAAPAKKKKP